MMLISVLILATLGSLSTTLAAQEPTQRVDLQRFGFTLTVPAEWTIIPDSLIADIAERASAAGSRPIKYVSGLQVGPSDYWLAYPYVLVQIQDAGPITDAQLVSALTGENAADALESAKERIERAGTISGVDFNTPVWDDSNRIVWMRIGGSNASGERFEGLSGLRTYARGFIAVHYYYPAGGDVEQIRAQLLPVLANITFYPGFEYNEAKARAARPAPVWQQILIGAAIGALIGGLTALMRRKRAT